MRDTLRVRFWEVVGGLKNFFEVFDLRLFWGGSQSKYPWVFTGGRSEDSLEGILWRGFFGGDSGKGYREGRFVRSLNAASGRISKSLI